MKRSTVNELPPDQAGTIASLPKQNGKSKDHQEALDLTVILTSLQTMRDGDFTVRLPGTWVGLAGKIADTFNEIAAANQHMSQELKRVGQSLANREKRASEPDSTSREG